MPRVLITGGAGFIGSHLCDRLLAQGHSAVVLDDLSSGQRRNVDPRARLIVGDIRNRDTVRAAMADVDGCFHLAAIASVPACAKDWAGAHAVNLTGAIHVFESAAAKDVPVIYASSAAVYGDQAATPAGARIAEVSPRAPLSAYGADKLACELHASAGARSHGLRATGLRFFNIYGPRQDPRSPYSGVISIFAARAARRAPLTLFGDGEQTRDFVYVRDVVEALIRAWTRCTSEPHAKVLNVCTGRATSVRALAQEIGLAAGHTPELIFAPARVGDIRTSVGDPSSLEATLGFIPATPLPVGLDATLAWLRKEETGADVAA